MADLDVDRASVEAARRRGGGELWIELRSPSSDAGVAFTTVLEELEEAGGGGPIGSLGLRSADGHVSLVRQVDDRTRLDAWIEALAAGLRSRGVEGALVGVQPAPYPSWIRYEDTVPTAFSALTLDLAAVAVPGGRYHWGAPAAATARACVRAADWTGAGGPQILLRRETFTCRATDGAAIVPFLLDATATSPRAGALGYDDDRRRGRATALGPGGRIVLQHLHRAAAWETQVDELRTALVEGAGDVDLGFVRPARPHVTGWGDIAGKQRLPALRDSDLKRGRHLLIDHVPDAHGLQVLGTAHLARAHDLSGWDVVDLGHGRHLVEAPDLEPWFGRPQPDPAVVDRARADFGAMVLTREAIAAHPRPWTPRDV